MQTTISDGIAFVSPITPQIHLARTPLPSGYL
nr:unnamed protein product [Callosobruchus analis]